MSVKDFIKQSVLNLDTYSSEFTISSIVSIAVALIAALLMGLLISLIYKKFYRGVVYNRNFAITLVGMSVLTAMVTLAISTNVVISLGMVGALSIVRFRTAIKNPLDLLYLFWAITTGITVGAAMYPLALISAVVVFLVILIMTRKNRSAQVYIAIIHYQGIEALESIKVALAKINYRIKSKTLHGDSTEMAVEVMTSSDSLGFADRIRAINGVTDITVIQYDGDYND